MISVSVQSSRHTPEYASAASPRPREKPRKRSSSRRVSTRPSSQPARSVRMLKTTSIESPRPKPPCSPVLSAVSRDTLSSGT